MNNYDYKKLHPFKWFVLQNFPFIEADFDAIAEYQLFCKVVEYLNKTINSVNELGTQVEWITNYFENLDVQDEINNKLDEMVESGELQSIITQYLQVAGVLAYNTLNDLKNASNLIDGSIAMTFGKTTYNDGQGAFYKIRTITSGDTVDEENIVAVNFSNTLIAEKQHSQIIKNIQTELATKEIPLKDKKFIFLGDSYDAGQSHDAQITKWGEDLATKLGITDYYNLYSLGAGFYATGSGGKTFQNILENNIANIPDKNEIDYIVVGGGYNDAGYSSTYTQIISAIESFCSYCATNFPKAQILIACFGYHDGLSSYGVSVRTHLYNYVIPAYKHNFTIQNQPIYIKNSEFILHNEAYFSSDYIHPNQEGINKIVSCLYEYFKSGNINISSPIYNNSYITVDETNINFIEQLIDENKINVKISNPTITFASEKTFTASNTPFKIGTHNSKIIRGSTNALCALKNLDILLTIHNGANYTNDLIKADLIFSGNGDLLLCYKELNDQHSWRSITNITQILIENLNSDYITPYFN